KRIVVAAMSAIAACAVGLAAVSGGQGPVWLMYLLLFGIGVARAFQSPAFSALTAQAVPPAHFASAATWSSGAWQSASILGPALGGFLVAIWGGAAAVYAVAGGLLVIVAVLLALMRSQPIERTTEPVNLNTLLAGARFISHTPVILAAITLDMFAVLLGGATALLPAFARDILDVGPVGLGWLRAAPAAGAIAAALIIALRPPFRYAGRTLLLVVAGFGLATIAFGLSRSFFFSLAMLALLGGLDNVSVVIRSTLLLTRTPDAVRGRVNSVHSVFVGISNELGAFESGLAAALLTTVGAVVAGGIGTLLVVAAIAFHWPQLRRLGRLDAVPVAHDLDAPPEVP
ncbi:MAG TPA: MFS transporter, partial [Chloroflexia bacterium]|nr:MFS transporter [Chloroflexia bacterium]